MSAKHSTPHSTPDSAPEAGCESCRDRIGPWLDGELEASAAAAVERHLDACTDCRAIAADHRAISLAIRSLAEAPVPALDLEAIRARARRIDREEIVAIRTLKRLAAAAAVVLALALGAAFWSTLGQPDDGGIDADSKRDTIMALVLSSPNWDEEFR